MNWTPYLATWSLLAAVVLALAVYRKFLSSDAAFYNTFNVQHHLVSAKNHLAFRAESMDMWREAAITA